MNTAGNAAVTGKKNDTSIKFKEHKWLFIASVKYLGCPEQWVNFLLCTFSMFYFSSMTRETFNYSDSTIQLYFFTLILVAHMDHDSGTSVHKYVIFHPVQNFGRH